MVLNGWAASPDAWRDCTFRHDALYSYIELLDGLADGEMDYPGGVVLVGWSMGGSYALRLALRRPEAVRALVLIATTPRMMESRAEGWKGMSPHRLEALRYGLKITGGKGLFEMGEGRPSPYVVDSDENLDRGLRYLVETDLREKLLASASRFAGAGVSIVQSERDGVVRPENASFLKGVFPHAAVDIVPGVEHALPATAPERIDAAVAEARGSALDHLLAKGEGHGFGSV